MSEYRDHAYERTVVQYLQRVLLDRVIASDSPPKETLVCEEVFRSESEVPQDALMRVFEKLQLWENDQRTKMNSFKWRKDEVPLPFLGDDAAKPPAAEAKTNGKEKPKRKRRKTDPSPEGSGQPA